MNWLKNLSVAKQDAVHTVMWSIDVEANRLMDLHRKDLDHLSKMNAIPVGATHMDSFLRCEAAMDFLRCLRQGCAPAEAEEKAKTLSTLAVKIHNSRRPKDINWARWDQTEYANIETYARRIIEAAS